MCSCSHFQITLCAAFSDELIIFAVHYMSIVDVPCIMSCTNDCMYKWLVVECTQVHACQKKCSVAIKDKGITIDICSLCDCGLESLLVYGSQLNSSFVHWEWSADGKLV